MFKIVLMLITYLNYKWYVDKYNKIIEYKHNNQEINIEFSQFANVQASCVMLVRAQQTIINNLKIYQVMQQTVL